MRHSCSLRRRRRRLEWWKEGGSLETLLGVSAVSSHRRRWYPGTSCETLKTLMTLSLLPVCRAELRLSSGGLSEQR